MQDAVGAVADPLSLAAQAIDAGVATLLLLDLGRIGTGCGVDLGLLETLRRRFPDSGCWPAAECLPGATSSACGTRAATARSLPVPSIPDDDRRGPGRARPAPASGADQSGDQGLAVGGRLAVVLLHLELHQRQVGVAAGRQLLPAPALPRYCASISAVLFGIGSRAQSRSGKDVGRLSEVVHGQAIALFAEGQLGIQGGEQNLVIDGVDQTASDLLQDAEVEHEERLRVHRSLDRHPDPVIMPVERLALVPLKVMKWADAKTR